MRVFRFGGECAIAHVQCRVNAHVQCRVNASVSARVNVHVSMRGECECFGSKGEYKCFSSGVNECFSESNESDLAAEGECSVGGRR